MIIGVRSSANRSTAAVKGQGEPGKSLPHYGEIGNVTLTGQAARLSRFTDKRAACLTMIRLARVFLAACNARADTARLAPMGRRRRSWSVLGRTLACPGGVVGGPAVHPRLHSHFLLRRPQPHRHVRHEAERP